MQALTICFIVILWVCIFLIGMVFVVETEGIRKRVPFIFGFGEYLVWRKLMKSEAYHLNNEFWWNDGAITDEWEWCGNVRFKGNGYICALYKTKDGEYKFGVFNNPETQELLLTSYWPTLSQKLIEKIAPLVENNIKEKSETECER